MNPMSKAISKKRGHGIDLNITIGLQKDGPKSSSMAPHPEHMEHDAPPGQDMMHAGAGDPTDHEKEMHDALMGPVDERDTDHLHSRQPRSLMERAKMAALREKTKVAAKG